MACLIGPNVEGVDLIGVEVLRSGDRGLKRMAALPSKFAFRPNERPSSKLNVSPESFSDGLARLGDHRSLNLGGG